MTSSSSVTVPVPSNKDLKLKFNLRYANFFSQHDHHAKALSMSKKSGLEIPVPKSRRRRFVMTEKVDGVRAMWNGSELLARRGGDLKPPRSLVSGLPAGSDTALVGELCATAGDPDLLKGLVGASPAAAQKTHEQQKTQLVLFDDMASTDPSYTRRLARLDKIARMNKAGRVKTVKVLGQVDLAPSSPANRSTQIQKILNVINVAKKQDEGVVLTRADGLPDDTRFKVKNMKQGMATVLAASGLKTADGRERRFMTVEATIKIKVNKLNPKLNMKKLKKNKHADRQKQQYQQYRVSFNVKNSPENRKRIFRGAQIKVLFRLKRDKQTRKVVGVVDCKMI